MKIRLERNGTVFEFERKQMPEGRFRAICAIAGAGMYAGMAAAVTAMCGEFGLLMVLAGTVLVAMVVKGLE